MRQLERAVRPRRGILLEAPVQQRIPGPIEARDQAGNGLEAANRQLPGKQLVGHDSERVQIGAVIGAAGILALLGRHVVRGAHRDIALRQHLGAFGVQAGQAEVEHLGTPIAQHQHVVGLQVAVYHGARMPVGERVRHLRQQPRQGARRRTGLEGVRAQRNAVDQFHADPEVRATSPPRQEPHDSGVIELSHRRGLAVESAHVVGHRGKRRREDLDRHRPRVGEPGGAVDLPHAALPEALVQGETLELRKGHGPGRRRYGDLRRLGTRLVAARIVRRDLQGGGRRAVDGIRISDRRQLFPEEPVVGTPRPHRPARLAALHREPDAASCAADQRAGDVRAHVGARFAVGTALKRTRRRARPLLGERPRHWPRV